MDTKNAVEKVIKTINKETLKKIQQNIYLPLEKLLSPSKRQLNNPPRQQNKFIIYRKDRLAKIISESSKKNGNSSVQFSKTLANSWKNESEEIKNIFDHIFLISKQVHKQVYPNYIYQPKNFQRRNHEIEFCFYKFDDLRDDAIETEIGPEAGIITTMEIPMTNLMKSYDEMTCKILLKNQD